MDHTAFGVMLGTIIIILAWIYLYVLYRERYLGIWTISWLIFFGRLVVFDYAAINWKQSFWAFTVFQLSFIVCGLLFLWGIYIFMDKPLKKYWLYSGTSAFLLSTLFAILKTPMVYKLLPAVLFSSTILIYVGKIFICNLKTKGIGNYIVGISFIGWGLITLFMSYTFSIPLLFFWAHVLSGYFRLAIALGIILVYFEKTRADLTAKEAQYRRLAENAIDVIYRYNLMPQSYMEYISPAVLSTTGYTPEEFYADPGLLVRLVYSDDAPLFSNFLNNPTPFGELPLTLRMVRRNGTLIWIEQKAVPVYNQDGSLAALEGILRDVTARKAMEQLVFRAENMNMVGQMAVSVAHEMRNPLTAVRGYLQMMRRKPENSFNLERFDLMIRELDRTNAIISEYLLMAQNKVPNRKSCDLNALITAIHPLVLATAAASTAYITLSLGEIPVLSLDENEIRQLLFNLVNNGLEAMPHGGELVIATFSSQNAVVLALSDHGPGISPPILEQLGTPFVTTKDTGTGLGLPMCYRIAARHDAVIRVETSDQGATFLVEFSLPRPLV